MEETPRMSQGVGKPGEGTVMEAQTWECFTKGSADQLCQTLLRSSQVRMLFTGLGHVEIVGDLDVQF